MRLSGVLVKSSLITSPDVSTDLNQAEDIFPARFFAPSGPAISKSNSAGKRKERKTMNPLLKFKTSTLFLIPLVLVCFALLPRAQAVTPELLPAPAPDGGYPGFNTAEGFNALLSLTSGQLNTAFGFAALKSDTTGGFNTAVGGQALKSNTGSGNTAVGANALVSNISGSENVAVGMGALAGNLIGSANVAMGFQALNANTAFNNVAVGDQALRFNSTGFSNVAVGSVALVNNTTGNRNTAIGGSALVINDTGALNTAVGVEALFSNNGTNNIALGFRAGSNLTAGNNNIDIGNAGVAAESATIRIGSFQTRTFIAGIRGRTTGFANAVPVLIDTAGQLGTASSSRRFKNDIKSMDEASEAILALKPVTFHYKSDSTGTPQFGLIAEEVAAVNPDLVVRDDQGQIYTVRYDAVNAMLLNEFLREHRKVREQEARITQLNSTVEKQQATIAQQQKDSQSTAAEQQREIKALAASLKEQAAQIQKVNAQIELQSVPPSTVVNNP